MRNKQDPIEFLLEENPELEWDDLHDVREIAELLGAMVTDLEEKVYDKTWYRLPDNADLLIDHYFYLVTHADFGTPMKAKYHDDMGGYFEIFSNDKKIPVEYINPILGNSKIKYYMPLPEMPDDYADITHKDEEKWTDEDCDGIGCWECKYFRQDKNIHNPYDEKDAYYCSHRKLYISGNVSRPDYMDMRYTDFDKLGCKEEK